MAGLLDGVLGRCGSVYRLLLGFVGVFWVDVGDGGELEELVDVGVVECAGLSGDGVRGGGGEPLDDGVGPGLFVVSGVEDAGEECVARSDGGVDSSGVDEDASDEFVVRSDVDDAFGAA